MDEDSLDEKPLGSLSSKQRSPSFNKEEIKALINLVEKYKNIILNKLTNHAANYTKELAWTKITKAFNNQGFKNDRSVDNLKTKWDNLKKNVKRISKNLMEVDHDDIDEVNSQLISLINEMENTNEIILTRDYEKELKGLEVDEPKKPSNITDSEKYWNTNKDLNSEEGEDTRKRSMNFTPQECSILLRCVRTEKRYIFSKDTTGKAIKLKNQAWNRIARCYNEICPTNRSKTVLRTKFTNMKRRASREAKFLLNKNSVNKYSKPENGRNVMVIPLSGAERQKRYMQRMKEKNPEKFETKRKKHLERVKKNQKKVNELTDEEKSCKREKWRKEKQQTKDNINKRESEEKAKVKVKTEPVYDDDASSEVYNDDDEGRKSDEDDNGSSNLVEGLHSSGGSDHAAPDPLSTVMNSDSGLGFMNIDAFNSDDKEVVRLKTELLQYQLETAKLERKRIENAIRVEAEANHASATERALRLRAARIEAVSAAMKLAPEHPALLFTAEERLAQSYLSQYRQSLESKDLLEP